MKCAVHVFVLAILVGALGCRQQDKELDAGVAKLTEIKEAQAKQMVLDMKLEMPSEGWKLFTAIRSDNFPSAARLFSRLESRHSAGPNAMERAKAMVVEKLGYPASFDAVDSAVWHAMLDAYWAYALTKQWTNKFLRLAVDDIVTTVPANAILFAGSDVARFSVSVWTETQTNGRPFYVISQTQLADWNYPTYLTSAYGTKVRLPDQSLILKAFQTEYARPGVTNYSKAAKGVNSALTRYIFDQNLQNEFYVQPYWILDWMYPRLAPQGPLLKICREPLPSLPRDSVRANRQYWSGVCAKLIGDWITESTTPMEVCDFAEKVYLRRNMSGFKGDPDYVSDIRAQDAFAAFRFATADLYLWRCVEASQVTEKQWMQNEYLLAFGQAFALGPRNSKVTYYFADVLAQINRYDEALRILEIGISLQPADPDLKTKREEIKVKAKSAGSN